MTPQQHKNRTAELEQWLKDNPNHPNRTIIETDLRKLTEERTYERDTFDIREHNFHNA
jgi:hypothetical protein